MVLPLPDSLSLDWQCPIRQPPVGGLREQSRVDVKDIFELAAIRHFLWILTAAAMLFPPESAMAKSKLEFHRAARAGDIETLARMLEAGTPIDSVDHHGQTALHWASRVERQKTLEQQLRSVKFLISRGANVNAKSNLSTALHAAMGTRYGTPIALELISFGADVNAINHMQFNPLGTSLYYGYSPEDQFMAVLDAMLAAGLNVNYRKENGDSVLHFAAGHRPIAVEKLVRAGADVNVVGWGGKTPLHLVSERYKGSYQRPGSADAIQSLIDAGAELEALDNRMLSPLAVAGLDAAHILLAQGASPGGLPNGKPPLHQAVSIGDSAKTELLVAAGADVGARWNERTVMDHLYAKMRRTRGPYDPKAVNRLY